MNYKIMSRFLSNILLLESLFMIPALLISFGEGNLNAATAFLITIAATALCGIAMRFYGRNAKKSMFAREGLVCTGLTWVLVSLFGALPFYFSGEIPSYIVALFEIVSGFTTTGASILKNVEAMSMGMLYWRSFSHWLGGMGILVFLLALTSTKGNNSGITLHILRAESPGPSVEKLVPSMRKSTTYLYGIYLALTILDIFFLMLGDLPLFDAVCTAFGTAGTGGFGIKADSIAGYSPYIQVVCTVFMMLFGINFNIYFFGLIGKFKDIFKDEELRFYLGTFAVSAALIAFNISGLYSTVSEAIRHSTFQVASIMTTTGFATADFDLWPGFSKMILLVLMICGASAGSTGGGLKCSRVLLILKSAKRTIQKFLFPNRVSVIRMNGNPVDEKIIDTTNKYLGIYFLIMFISVILISVDNFSITTNISAMLACLNNIGPGFDAVGPTCNYFDYSIFSKIVLIIDMLAGRLELIPILCLFAPATWKRR